MSLRGRNERRVKMSMSEIQPLIFYYIAEIETFSEEDL